MHNKSYKSLLLLLLLGTFAGCDFLPDSSSGAMPFVGPQVGVEQSAANTQDPESDTALVWGDGHWDEQQWQ